MPSWTAPQSPRGLLAGRLGRFGVRRRRRRRDVRRRHRQRSGRRPKLADHGRAQVGGSLDLRQR
ncbi:MAG: hypothetical protein FJ137_05700 [Deltaproteobacteria bacterium]|nr:hypothetical protein [Deltaproteobacteria bacterium]